MRPVTFILCVMLSLIPVSCSTRPPVKATGGRFTVYASDQETAQRFLAIASRITPRICSMVPGCTQAPIDIWVLAEQGDSSHFRGTIRLRATPKRAANTLVHELVHASLGPVWSDLPVLLEEGLCDYVAIDLAETPVSARTFTRLMEAGCALGIPLRFVHTLRSDRPEGGEPSRVALAKQLWFEDTPKLDVEKSLRKRWLLPNSLRISIADRPLSEYGLGYLLTSEIIRRGGIDALLHLITAEGLPTPEQILAAAGVSDVSALRSRLRALLDEECVRRGILDEPHWLISEALNWMVESEPPHAFKHAAWTDLNTAIEESDPGLWLHDGTEIHLRDFPEFRAAVARELMRRKNQSR